MKVTLTLEWLAFHLDSISPEVKAEIMAFVHKHELYHIIEKNKLQVKGTREELYYMLFTFTQENDIDLI